MKQAGCVDLAPFCRGERWEAWGAVIRGFTINTQALPTVLVTFAHCLFLHLLVYLPLAGSHCVDRIGLELVW